jgi:hypothetical protein
MLNVLCRPNQTRVHYLRLGIFFHQLLAIRNHTFHALALLATRTPIQLFEDFLKPLDVPFCLFEVLLKALLQFWRSRLFYHLRQGFQYLVFRRVQVFQFVDHKVFQGFHFHNAPPI